MATDSNGQKPKRNRILVGLAIVLGLAVLWVLYVLISAYSYYRNTPTFDEFLLSHPVAEEFVLQQLPGGTLLHEGGSWTVGESPAETWDTASSLSLETRITRGEASLMEAKLVFTPVLESDSGVRKGFKVPLPQVVVRDGMRAIFQVSLYRTLETLGESGDFSAQITLDSVLVAGSGSPAGVPPQEGFLYHARSSFYLPLKGQVIGPNCSFDENAEAYSAAFFVAAQVSREGTTSTQSFEFSRTYTWNGQVW